MSISALDKTQWFSVVRNAVFTFIATFIVTVLPLIQTQHITKPGLLAAASAGVMAVIKIIQKLYTPTAPGKA